MLILFKISPSWGFNLGMMHCLPKTTSSVIAEVAPEQIKYLEVSTESQKFFFVTIKFFGKYFKYFLILLKLHCKNPQSCDHNDHKSFECLKIHPYIQKLLIYLGCFRRYFLQQG